MKKLDHSNWMEWLVLIIASFIFLPINAEEGCPDGTASLHAASRYSSYQACDYSRVMYILPSNNVVCCVPYQCKHTGMKARFLVKDYKSPHNYPLFAVTKSNAFWKEYVYENTQNGNEILCPYPIGYLWFKHFPTPNGHVPRQFLPIDHEYTTSILRSCNKNEDCPVDAFCGDVINRSFDGKYSRSKNTPNQFCTIYSEGGNCNLIAPGLPYVDEHKHFCYKVPQMIGAPSSNVQYWMESTGRNLKLCDQDHQCGDGRKCLLSKTIGWSAYNRETNQREEHAGICIESMPISYTFYKIFDAQTASQQESVGRKYFPVNSENKRRNQLVACKKNWDCLDQEFCGHVYSFNDVASMGTIKYCFKLPEDLTNAFVKPDGVDLLVCDGNQDCDSGTCDTSAQKNFVSNVNSQQKVFNGICSKPPAEEEEEDSSLIIIIVVTIVALIVVIFATLIGGFVLFKLKKKPTNCATETTGDGKKNKKAKKEKKAKKGKKPSAKTSTTTKSLSVTGKSGMGTTTGGYSPAIF